MELADTLVDDFDAVDLMHMLTERVVELLAADAAGIILADHRGQLQVVATTHHEADVLEAFQVQNSEGPCLEAYRTGHAIVNVDVDEVEQRWPRFTQAWRDAGFRSTHAIPMRLRDQVLGGLNIFCVDRVTLTEADVALAQAMADVATIALLQARVVRERELLAEQLQTALNTRILIEQAKGVLAERASLTIPQAFELMRAYSRRSSRPLVDVSLGVIDRAIDVETMRE